MQLTNLLPIDYISMSVGHLVYVLLIDYYLTKLCKEVIK